MKLNEILKEERTFGQKLRRGFNKMMTWDYVTPQEMMERIRNMSDRELINLSKHDNIELTGDGSSRRLQLKLINRELKRRFGVNPQGSMR